MLEELSALDAEYRANILAALERHAIFKPVGGVVYCCAYAEAGWEVWPLNGGDSCYVDTGLSVCSCQQPKCDHIMALKGGDTQKPWSYKPLKRKKLGKWYIHKHDGNRR